MAIISLAGLIRTVFFKEIAAATGVLARRAVLRDILDTAVSYKLPIPSNLEIGNIFRRYGGHISNVALEAITKPPKQAVRLLGRQVGIDMDTTILATGMPEHPMHLSREYLYEVTIDVIPYGGESYESRVFRLSHNKELSKREVLDTFYSNNVDRFDSADVNWESMKFSGAFKSE